MKKKNDHYTTPSDNIPTSFTDDETSIEHDNTPIRNDNTPISNDNTPISNDVPPLYHKKNTNKSKEPSTTNSIGLKNTEPGSQRIIESKDLHKINCFTMPKSSDKPIKANFVENDLINFALENKKTYGDDDYTIWISFFSVCFILNEFVNEIEFQHLVIDLLICEIESHIPDNKKPENIELLKDYFREKLLILFKKVKNGFFEKLLTGLALTPGGPITQKSFCQEILNETKQAKVLHELKLSESSDLILSKCSKKLRKAVNDSKKLEFEAKKPTKNVFVKLENLIENYMRRLIFLISEAIVYELT